MYLHAVTVVFPILGGVISQHRERRKVHPDSPAALYKDKEKKALVPLYLDGLYWASCLCLTVLSCMCAAATNHSPEPCGRPPSTPSHSESEPDNYLRDNNTEEETRGRDGGGMTVVGGEREVVNVSFSFCRSKKAPGWRKTTKRFVI